MTDGFSQSFEIELKPEDRLNEVFDKMVLLGDNYAILAKDSENVKDASYYLSLAERAYNIAIKARNSCMISKKRVEIQQSSHLEIFSELLFPGGNYKKLNQADLWKLYILFCDRVNINCRASKSEVFNYFKSLGFVQYKASGLYWFLPSGRRRVEHVAISEVQHRINDVEIIEG